MRVVVQRVNHAIVSSTSRGEAAIGRGMLVLLGIEHEDNESDIEWLVGKLARLRIFADEEGVMNRSIQEFGGSFLVVSQFTLHASTKKGNRPSYIRAANPDTAIPLYEKFVSALQSESGLEVKTGWFGANMQVSLENDGPVTIIIDTKNRE